jgi:hypothetical protein
MTGSKRCPAGKGRNLLSATCRPRMAGGKRSNRRNTSPTNELKACGPMRASLAISLDGNCIQLADPAQRFSRRHSRLAHMQVMDFAARMGHARRLAHPTVSKDLVVARERVCLQDAAEVGQVRLRVLDLAVRRVGEPRRRRCRRSGAAIIAYVDPRRPVLV